MKGPFSRLLRDLNIQKVLSAGRGGGGGGPTLTFFCSVF